MFALIMLMITTVSSLAVEVTEDSFASQAEFSAITNFSNSVMAFDEVMPYEAGILREINWVDAGYSGFRSYDVTPTRNHKLRLKIANTLQFSDTLTVTVTKKGSSSTIKTLYIPRGTDTSYILVDNCNGGTYTVKIYGTMAQYYAVLYQTEII